MIELYFGPGACSFVPHVALEVVRARTGTGYEPRLVKLHRAEHRTPEYLALNPEGLVPLLVVDGQPLSQIVAICDYLDRRFPDAGLLPRDEWARAQAMSRLAWMNNTVHPTFTHFFMPGKFTDDRDAQGRLKTAALAPYREHLERIQGWIAQASPAWLCGERISFLDAYALTLLRWGGMMGIDPDTLPAYKAFVERLAGEPAVAAALERERIPLNPYKAA